MTYSQSVQFDDAEIVALAPRFASVSSDAPPNANWTARIGSASLRAEIAANPRLVHRIARLRNSPQRERSVDRDAHAHPRSRQPSAHSQPTPAAAEPPPPPFEPTCMAFEAYMDRSAEAVRLAGLIWNAASLSQIIAGPQLRILSQSVSEPEINYALNAASLAMDDTPFDSLDPLSVTDRLHKCGEQAVAAWALQLSPELQKRVVQSLSADASIPPVEACAAAAAVLQAALRGLLVEQERAA